MSEPHTSGGISLIYMLFGHFAVLAAYCVVTLHPLL